MAVPMPLKRAASEDFLPDGLPSMLLSNGVPADMRVADMRADLLERRMTGDTCPAVHPELAADDGHLDLYAGGPPDGFTGLYLPAGDQASLIQCSPIKMLNTVARARATGGAKKRRLDDGTAAVVDGSSSPLTGDEAGDAETAAAAVAAVAVPPQRHNFPCVWMDGAAPGTQSTTPPPAPVPPRPYVVQTPHAASPPQTVLPPGGSPENRRAPPMLPPGTQVPPEHLHRPVLPPSGPAEHRHPLLPPGASPERLAAADHRQLLAPAAATAAAAAAAAAAAMQPLPAVGVAGGGPPVEGGDGAAGPGEVCPECHKVFKRRVYLQRHMEREHWSTAKVFRCDDCAYETKHQSNLSVHRRTHTGERTHTHACTHAPHRRTHTGEW